VEQRPQTLQRGDKVLELNILLKTPVPSII